MGALLALLLPMIPGLIQGVQAVIKAKPAPAPGPTPAPPVSAAGQAKADAVLVALRAVIEKLAAINAPLPDGTLPAAVPVTDDALRAAIETIYQQMKAGGNLTPAAPTGTLWLVQGSVQQLKVGGTQ
jgi:hypothetical protein